MISKKNLFKISTTDEDTVNVFTYKKGGFKNYAACVKNVAKLFCFKHIGNQLVFSARASLGPAVSFWMTGQEQNKIVACPSATKEFIANTEGYRFCYPKGGKVVLDGDSIGFSAANDVAAGEFMGGVEIKEFKGTLNDYLVSLESDGVVTNKKNIINKMGLPGVSYEFGSGGIGLQSVIFQKSGADKLYVISFYNTNEKESSEFLQMVTKYFSFLK